MTWGIIPKENNNEIIYCGDAKSYGTKELNFEIIESTCVGIVNDFNIKINNNELWDSESIFYEAVAKYLSIHLEISIAPSIIYGGYLLANDEPDHYSSTFEIIDSEAGVFKNIIQQHNVKVFLRYYFEEENEIFDEVVCVAFV